MRPGYEAGYLTNRNGLSRRDCKPLSMLRTSAILVSCPGSSLVPRPTSPGNETRRGPDRDFKSASHVAHAHN